MPTATLLCTVPSSASLSTDHDDDDDRDDHDHDDHDEFGDHRNYDKKFLLFDRSFFLSYAFPVLHKGNLHIRI